MLCDDGLLWLQLEEREVVESPEFSHALSLTWGRCVLSLTTIKAGLRWHWLWTDTRALHVTLSNQLTDVCMYSKVCELYNKCLLTGT